MGMTTVVQVVVYRLGVRTYVMVLVAEMPAPLVVCRLWCHAQVEMRSSWKVKQAILEPSLLVGQSSVSVSLSQYASMRTCN